MLLNPLALQHATLLPAPGYVSSTNRRNFGPAAAGLLTATLSRAGN
jgi:hypothetical protein